MSDFDEEAERERLREQFERDQKKREATEQMSELLLQGATMTDAHCETCGDPIFRYDGQEFCPTCQGSAGENAEGATEGTQSGTEPSGDASAEPASTQPSEASADATSTPERSTGGAEEQTQNAPTASQSDPSTDAQTTPAAEPPADGTTGQQATPTEETGQDRRLDVPALDPDQREPTAHGSDDLQDARESLVATLSSFARQAEATDDPRRARDALEAAREAAETLAALDRRR
ncbi:MAG: Sjogren's syndrome/scleroderma autoantigen 1 family protein [Halorhabdus sp.]